MRRMSFFVSAGEKSCSKSPSVEPLVGVYAVSDCIAASVFSMSWVMMANQYFQELGAGDRKTRKIDPPRTNTLATVLYCYIISAQTLICQGSFPFYHAKSHGGQPFAPSSEKAPALASGTKQMHGIEDTEAAFLPVGFAAHPPLPFAIVLNQPRCPSGQRTKNGQEHVETLAGKPPPPTLGPGSDAHGSASSQATEMQCLASGTGVRCLRGEDAKLGYLARAVFASWRPRILTAAPSGHQRLIIP
jgi:hypothetical protein